MRSSLWKGLWTCPKTYYYMMMTNKMAVTSSLSAATNIIATDNDIRVTHSLLYVIMFHFLMH